VKCPNYFRGEKMEKRKLIDFYELTMAYTDFKNNKANSKNYFDIFFRNNLNGGKYNISGGLEEIIDYVNNFKFEKQDIEYLKSLNQFDDEFLNYLKNFKFCGNIYAVPDGTVIFPNEPIITVYGNSIETQILETDLLNKFNHGSLITTTASKIVKVAKGRGVMEFGARRAQGGDAAIVGAKYAYLAGAVGTSCFETGKKYNIPIMGTMAHSHIMKYENEYEAFLAYAKVFPKNCILLVDTYDTINSGIKNAIRVADEYLIPNGFRLKGIRIDSGDLLTLSKKVRNILDTAGLNDCAICVSNSLNEKSIRELLDNNAPIDSFGVGENLITARDCPVFGGVYKLVAVEENGKIIPKIKISEDVVKITNPGYKKFYRVFTLKDKKPFMDFVALHDEKVENIKKQIKNNPEQEIELKEMQVPIFINGKLVYQQPTIKESRNYCKKQVEIFENLFEKQLNFEVQKSIKLLDTINDLIIRNKVSIMINNQVVDNISAIPNV